MPLNWHPFKMHRDLSFFSTTTLTHKPQTKWQNAINFYDSRNFLIELSFFFFSLFVYFFYSNSNFLYKTFYLCVRWYGIENLIGNFFMVLIVCNAWHALHANWFGDTGWINAWTVGAHDSIVSACSNFEAFLEEFFADGLTPIRLINCYTMQM